ncbi:SCO0930 family lipoprotein [Streptomyces sp. NPDC054796]
MRSTRNTGSTGKRRHVALASAAVVVALMASACGTSGGTAQGNGTVRPAGDSSEAADGYGGAGDGYGSGADKGSAQTGKGEGKGKRAAARTLAVRDVAKLGEVVTDSKGWTLYRFDEDTASPPRSSCEGTCAEAWPPVPAADATAADGIAPERLGKVERADGTWQLTLAGWPVYRYAKDTAPGDTKGHGVGGTWNALAPDGKKAGRSAAQLTAVDNADLGTILTDAKGRTLYRFDKDTAWPMKSNCEGACLDTWKPAKPVSKDKLSGVAKKLVGTYKRADGTGQLAVDCWPVYWFTGDEQPGDVNGQNKQGLWHAVTDKGGKAKGEVTSSGSGDTGGTGDSSGTGSGSGY